MNTMNTSNTSYPSYSTEAARRAQAEAPAGNLLSSLLAMLIALFSSRLFRGIACAVCAVGALCLIGALQAGTIAALPCILLCAVIGICEYLLLR